MPDFQALGQLVNFLDKAGVIGILLLNLFVLAVGAQRQWWVPGTQFKKAEKTSSRWEELALQLLNSADRSVSLAEFFRNADR